MNRHTRIHLLPFILMILAVAPACVAQTYIPQPFSADMTATSPAHEKTTGKFFFSPPSVRMDMSAKGHNVSSIATADKAYVLMHDQHMYMEMPLNQPNPMMAQAPKVATSFDPNNPCASQLGVTCKKVGTETVNGRVCDKWQSTSDEGGATTMWMDQKLHFPIKSVSSNGSGMELSNVKEGKPDASLFQPPAGYRKFDMSGMGARPQQ